MIEGVLAARCARRLTYDARIVHDDLIGYSTDCLLK